MENMETHKMFALSTGHVSKDTAEMLDLDDDRLGVVVYPKGDYGWFIPITEYLEESEREISPDIAKVVDYALARGFTWLMFDRDANVIDDLPLYDW